MMDNVSKATLGLEARRLRKPAKTGTTRNPALQAKVMNGAGVELHVLPGLPGLPCLGAAHPALATRSLDAPATVPGVKGRMLGNDPLAALHSSSSNYLKTPV